MKKKISLLLCVLLAIVCFVGCSNNKKVDLTDEQKDSMISQSEVMLELCTNTESYLGVTEKEFAKEINSYSEFELNNFIMSLNSFFAQYGISGVEIGANEFLGVFSSWEAAVEECGEFEELSGEFEVDEAKNTVYVEAKFEDRKATIVFGFGENTNMTSMDVSATYSTKEILTKAGQNTLMGMGVVFAVLLFLAFIISLMKYIPKTNNGQTTQTDVKDTEIIENIESTENTENTVQVQDDLELVAVITAAIAALEGTGTDGFIVRSIRRRPSNNWK